MRGRFCLDCIAPSKLNRSVAPTPHSVSTYYCSGVLSCRADHAFRTGGGGPASRQMQSRLQDPPRPCCDCACDAPAASSPPIGNLTSARSTCTITHRASRGTCPARYHRPATTGRLCCGALAPSTSEPPQPPEHQLRKMVDEQVSDGLKSKVGDVHFHRYFLTGYREGNSGGIDTPSNKVTPRTRSVGATFGLQGEDCW